MKDFAGVQGWRRLMICTQTKELGSYTDYWRLNKSLMADAWTECRSERIKHKSEVNSMKLLPHNH